MRNYYALARKDECHELERERLQTSERGRSGVVYLRESKSCLDRFKRYALVCCINSNFRETHSLFSYSDVSIRCILVALDPGLVLRWKQFRLFESVLSAGTVPIQQFYILIAIILRALYLKEAAGEFLVADFLFSW